MIINKKAFSENETAAHSGTSRRRFLHTVLCLFLVACSCFSLSAQWKTHIYHVDTNNVDLIFFSKNISQYVPHIINMHAQGSYFHNRIWNAPPYDSLCIYRPKQATMFLTDWEDDGNAGVSALPVNTILVGMSPMNNSFFVAPTVERYHHLFNHEQTHVVMSDKYTITDLRWRKFFGSKVAVDSHYPLSAFWSYATTPR